MSRGVHAVQHEAEHKIQHDDEHGGLASLSTANKRMALVIAILALFLALRGFGFLSSAPSAPGIGPGK
jgi:hypothetical protein